MSSQIEVVMTGDEAKLWRSFQKIVGGQKLLEDGFDKIKKKADQTEKSIEKMGQTGLQAFGTKAVAQLQDFAQGFGNVQAIVSVVSGAISQLKADTATAVQSIERLTEQRKEMAQLATGPEHYQMLSKSTQQLAGRFGLDLEEAHKLRSAALAGGFERSLPQVALATATFAPADELIPTAASLPKNFEGLTTEQALNLTAAGGTSAENMTFRGVAQQLRIAAQGAGPAGSSGVETAAMVAVLSDLFQESTGDRLRAMGLKIAMDPKLRGKGIMGTFDIIKNDPKKRATLLGDSQELHAVYNKLSASDNRDANRIRAMEAHLQKQMDATGTPNSPLMTGAQSFLSDPLNRALFNTRVARANREITQMNKLGPEGLQNEQDMERARQQMINRGVNPVSRYLAEGFMAADTYLVDPVMGKSGWRTQDGAKGPDAASKVLKDLGGVITDLKEVTGNLNNATKSRSDAQRAEAQGNRE